MQIKRIPILIISAFFIFSACSKDEMEVSNNLDDGEVSLVELAFYPDNGEAPVKVTWDGTSSTINQINLEEKITYNLTVTINSGDSDLTEEIQAKAEDYLFLFSFENGTFTNPAGNGNIDDMSDFINYTSFDSNGNPLGISTKWITGDKKENTSAFRIMVKNQLNGIKSEGATTNGFTFLELSFPLNIKEAEIDCGCGD